MEISITIEAESIQPSEVKNYLESRPDWREAGVALEFQSSAIRTRGIDPAVLVAIVGTAGTGLGALIAGLFQYLQQHSAQKIVIQSACGARLEFPADLDQRAVDALIQKVNNLASPQISLE